MVNFNYTHYKLQPIYRFSVALIFFALALISRFTFLTHATGGPFVTFYPAIILSFYFCGTFPGAMVAVLSGLAGSYYFIPPYNQFSGHIHISNAIIFFSITSTLIGFFISRLHRYIEETNVILNNEMIGSMMLRDRKIIWCNKAMSTILGYTQSELLGSSTKMLFADEAMYETVGRNAYPLKSGAPYRTQFEMKKVDGHKVWIEISGAAIPYDSGLSLWLVNDISKLKALEEELKHQIDHDFLTGLRSRAWFMEQATIELHRASRFNTPLSLLMLDIDFFKLVNDTYGHQAGDIALKSVAQFMQKILRDFDMCARMGGEEFMILLPQTNQDKALEVAERIRLFIQNTQVPLPTGESSLQLTVSIGLSSLSSKEDNIDDLINKADKALYQAKHTGRNRVCVAGLPDSQPSDSQETVL
ncbi:diguanylate cyclase [Methylotenera sp. G11]|uniref:diguanylate cyclase n=1 Tax=Methylotenera sp. G11 TaxID=1506585 RepID=UPI00068AEECF|nr:diguanylate cyclase [Methylotenera sp. G11]